MKTRVGDTVAEIPPVESAYVSSPDNRTVDSSLLFGLNMLTVSGRDKTLSGPHYRLLGLKPRRCLSVSKDDVALSQAQGFSSMQSHLMLPTRLKVFRRQQMPCTHGAITHVKKLKRQVPRWKKAGVICATVIMGNGRETLDQAIDIAMQLDAIAREHQFTLYLELHRGSVTQELSTVLAMIQACPNLRFNADFSHYLLSYRLDQINDVQLLDFVLRLQPIFQRVGYFHGRYASSDAIQTANPGDRSRQVYYVLMEQVFQYFKRRRSEYEVLFFSAELLPLFTGYADVTVSRRGHIEVQDRYQQALDLNRDMQKLFASPLYDSGLEPQVDNTASVVKLGEDSPVVDIAGEDALKQLAHSYTSGQMLRVRLGSVLNSAAEQQQLMQHFIALQRQQPAILLETARNTVTHTPEQTLHWLKRYPDLRLSLKASEWILGEEVTVGKLLSFYRRIRKLKPACAEMQRSYATAERSYQAECRYSPLACFNVSVIIEICYRIFYRCLQGRTR